MIHAWNWFGAGHHYCCLHASCCCTYQSWSPVILNILPKTITDQFTFHLTYWSSLMDSLASLLRESARVGLGAQVFRTLIQTLHYHRFDQLQCQFLEMIANHSVGSLSQCWTSWQPFGEFGDQNGYVGFIPSVQYFDHFYDMMVGEEIPQLQQVICSRPTNILKHDHTFKVSFCWVLLLFTTEAELIHNGSQSTLAGKRVFLSLLLCIPLSTSTTRSVGWHSLPQRLKGLGHQFCSLFSSLFVPMGIPSHRLSI